MRSTRPRAASARRCARPGIERAVTQHAHLRARAQSSASSSFKEPGVQTREVVGARPDCTSGAPTGRRRARRSARSSDGLRPGRGQASGPAAGPRRPLAPPAEPMDQRPRDATTLRPRPDGAPAFRAMFPTADAGCARPSIRRRRPAATAGGSVAPYPPHAIQRRRVRRPPVTKYSAPSGPKSRPVTFSGRPCRKTGRPSARSSRLAAADRSRRSPRTPSPE